MDLRACVRFSALIAALAALALFAAACSGGKKPAPSATPSSTAPVATATASATATPSPGACPVEQAICDFALKAEADLQRGDPWAFLGDDAPGQALRSQLSSGTGMVRLASVGCPAVKAQPDCRDFFALVFTSAGPGQDVLRDRDPGTFALVGLDRRSGPPHFAGLSLGPEREVLLHGGLAGACPLAQALGAAPSPPCLFYPYTNPGPPAVDRSLGFPAQPLTLAPDAAFPQDTSLIVEVTGYDHGPSAGLRLLRFDRFGDGPVQQRELYAIAPTNENITGVARMPSYEGVLWMAVCRGSGCLSEGEAGPDAATHLLRSDNGGITWTEVATRPGRWWLKGAIGVEALLANYDTLPGHYLLLPSGHEPVHPGPPVPLPQPLDFNAQVAWPTIDTPKLLAEDGSTLAELPLSSPHRLTITAVTGYPPGPMVFALDVAIGSTFESDALVNRYLAIASGVSGMLKVDRLLRLDSTWGESFGDSGVASGMPVVDVQWRRQHTCPGIDQPWAQGSAPAILDPSAATLALIADPFLCLAPGLRTISVTPNIAYRVDTPGDCLNIRVEPTTASRSVECVADGVLLMQELEREVGEHPDDWAPVVAPDGAHGWAARAFLAADG